MKSVYQCPGMFAYPLPAGEISYTHAVSQADASSSRVPLCHTTLSSEVPNQERLSLILTPERSTVALAGGLCFQRAKESPDKPLAFQIVEPESRC